MDKQIASGVESELGIRARITEFILNRGRVSKAEIGAALDLSRPTVINAVASLADAGIVRESGAYESTGGRRARVLSAVPSYRYFGGIDLTANHLAFVVVDWSGNVVAKARQRIRFENNRAYFDALTQSFASFIRPLGIKPAQLTAVGVSLPGILSEDRRVLVRSHALKVENLDLSSISSRLKGYSIDFENDANAAEIAERSTLQGHSIFITLSNTVGGSISVGGEMYLGDNRRAGEFGHMILHPGGQRCYCGKRGCADAYLSALRLAEKAENLENFFQRLEEGDKKLAKVWSAYLDDLATLVSNLRMSSDCEIVIGGYVGSLMGSHLADLRKRVSALDLFQNDASYLRLTKCGREASAIGAALILRDAAVARL